MGTGGDAAAAGPEAAAGVGAPAAANKRDGAEEREEEGEEEEEEDGVRSELLFLAISFVHDTDMTQCWSFREMQRLYSRMRNLTATAARAGEGDWSNLTVPSEDAAYLLGVKARLGGVLEHTRFGARLLRVCEFGARLACAQPAPTLRRTPDGVVLALSDALRFCAAVFPHQLFASEACSAPPPSLPYKVDTSRPSLRTNWTRLVGGRWACATPSSPSSCALRRILPRSRTRTRARTW